MLLTFCSPLSYPSPTVDRSAAGAHLNPAFSDDHNAAAASDQLRAKRKNQRDQQQLAMFLAINGGPKDTVYNHYVHTSQCPHRETGTGKCDVPSSTPSEDFISRTLGEILLKALKDRGVFNANANAEPGSVDGEELDDELNPNNEIDEDEGDVIEDGNDEGETDEPVEEDEHAHEDDHPNGADGPIGIEDSLVDETADIEHDEDQHPDEIVEDPEPIVEPEIIENPQPPTLIPTVNDAHHINNSESIDKIREILRSAFGIDCKCSLIPRVNETTPTPVNPSEPVDEPVTTTVCEEPSTTTTTPAPVVGQPPKPNCHKPVNHPTSTLNEQMMRAIADAAAKFSSIGTSIHVAGHRSKAKAKSVENTVNIQVNSNKPQRRPNTATDTKPTRVQLNTGDLPDLANESQAPIKTTARSVRKSNKASSSSSITNAEDLQFFRDQRDRSARRAHKRQQPARRRPATSAHGARRVRAEQSAALAAVQPASLDPAIVSALPNIVDDDIALVDVQRRERGAVVRRARRPEHRSDERPPGDRAASANHSARAPLSAGVKNAVRRPEDDSADVLLKRFLGLYERYKRSQDAEAYDDFEDADVEEDVSEEDDANESD